MNEEHSVQSPTRHNSQSSISASTTKARNSTWTCISRFPWKERSELGLIEKGMNTASKTFFLLAALLLATPTALHADELRFAKIFTDHGVLQRDMLVPVWGWTGPESKVQVEFAGQRKSATSNEAGKWMIKLAAMKAEEARKLIPHPTLRRFKVGPYIADEPLADIGADGAFQHPRWRMGDDGQWRTVDNERFGLDWISAVAAWFAHEVRISQDVPVGLIESNFGGSKLYCWMPRESLDHSPEFTRDVIELYRVQKAKWDESYAAWETDPNHAPDKPPTEPWRLSW